MLDCSVDDLYHICFPPLGSVISHGNPEVCPVRRKPGYAPQSEQRRPQTAYISCRRRRQKKSSKAVFIVAGTAEVPLVCVGFCWWSLIIFASPPWSIHFALWVTRRCVQGVGNPGMYPRMSHDDRRLRIPPWSAWQGVMHDDRELRISHVAEGGGRSRVKGSIYSSRYSRSAARLCWIL